MRKLLYSFICLSFVLTSLPVMAKKFTSQYCEFELPSGWECLLEGTEWVCQSQNQDRRKEAIIILAAKIRGSKDSLDQYQAYLGETKTFRLPGGKSQVSDPKYTKIESINSHRWVDSLHLASEVPGFYTRYLATVKSDLGVAVTFSVAKDHYNSYKEVFDSVARTLKVFRQANPNSAKDFNLKAEEEDLLDGSEFLADSNRRVGVGYQKQKQKKSASGEDDFILYIVIAAALVFVLMKLKKKKAPKKKKRKKKK